MGFGAQQKKEVDVEITHLLMVLETESYRLPAAVSLTRLQRLTRSF
jgi:hypothetical protein